MSPLLGILASWFREAASRAPAKRIGDRLIFPVVLRARIFCALGALILGPGFVVASLAPRTPTGVRILLVLLAIWLFHYWPWSVVIDREGVSKRKYFGLRKLLAWPEIQSLTYREKSEDYVLNGQDGTTIWFSSFHVDPGTFESEILKQSGVGKVDVTDPADDPYTRRRRAPL
jgi:hypothetical protein